MHIIKNYSTVLKTLSFAVCHFTVAFTVAYLLTGSIGISSLLAIVEPMCNTVAYFFHEKLWNRLQKHTACGDAAVQRSF